MAAKKAMAKKTSAKKSKPVASKKTAPAPTRKSAPTSGPLDPATQRLVELLRAGALLPHGQAARLPADVVSARAYAHPALGSRVVVRLTPDPVAEGEDRVHSFLGFGAPSVSPRVAVRGRRAIGFPAWALVHDPANARHALDVLGEMRRGIRQARSRPGPAKETFDQIAKRLGRQVPQFLPAFHEEVARVFAEAGNRSWAGQYFNKAREAERVHALRVDPEARSAAFLEFALSGALTTKALTEHAQELSRERDPASAYAAFRELCVRRTLGGVAPWGGMPRELRRLAKAAGLDPAREDEALMEDLLGAPALARAPADVWAEYREAILAVCKGSPVAVAGLLSLAPRPVGKTEGFHDRWLKLLEDAGAIDALAAGQVEVKAATWLTRMIGALNADLGDELGVPERLLVVTRRLAPRLVADGVAVRVDQSGNRWWRPIDVDLCDLLLELGAPLEAPSEEAELQLERWATPPKGSTERPRDPVRLAQDPRFARLLQDAVANLLSDETFNTARRGKQAFDTAIRGWLDRRVDAFGRAGLPAVADALGALGRTSRQVFADHRAVHDRLRTVDVVGALARTLRAGAYDELGWEALEGAVSELDPEGKGRITLNGAFPYVVVSNERRAIVLGPKGRVLEHDLRLPKKAEVELLRYAGGQLLVVYRNRSYALEAYWSSAPTKTFKPERGYFRDEASVGVELADGGITEGGRALRAGDTSVPEPRQVFSDGATFWRTEDKGDKPRLRELDPRTGDLGRSSWPRFFEEFVGPGWTLDLEASALAPLPVGLERTPLGVRDSLTGIRVRRPEAGSPLARERAPEVEGIDGRRFNGRLEDVDGDDDDDDESAVPCALVMLPHDARPRPLVERWSSLSLWAPEAAFACAELAVGRRNAYSQGAALVLPRVCWHHLAPRDDTGSRGLRLITDEQARALLDAALKGKGEGEDGTDVEAELRRMESVVRKTVKGVTAPRLARGVAGIVLEAARLTRTLAQLIASKDPSAAPEAATGGEGIPDDAVMGTLGQLMFTHYSYGGNVGLEIEQAAALFARKEPLDRPRSLKRSAIPWPDLVGRIGGVAFAAVATGTNDAQRDGLRRLLALWAKTPFASAPTDFRRATLTFAKFPYAPARSDDDDDDAEDMTWIVEVDGCRATLQKVESYLYDATDEDRCQAAALQRAPFKPMPGATVSEERPCEPGWGSPEQIQRFLSEAEKRGPIPWDPRIGEEISRRTGLSRAEAALVWACFPGFDNYESDFLGAERRAQFELKLNESKAAWESLKRVSHDKRLAALARALGDDPAALWTPLGGGPDDEDSVVARFCRGWIEAVGRRVAIAPELLSAARKDLTEYGCSGADVLELFAAPTSAATLTKDGASVVGRGEFDDEPADIFSASTLRAVALGIPYLFHTRPVGDPVRANIPDALRLTRERLKNPDLLLSLREVYLHGDEDGKKVDEKGRERLKQAILDGVGGKPVKLPKEEDDDDADEDGDGPRVGRDNGRVVAIADRWRVQLSVRPARVKSVDDLKELRRLRPGPDPTLTALELVLSEAYAAMSTRASSTTVSDGEWEANPLRSAPKLVSQVATKLDVGEDAAVLYLQTLALPSPATKFLQTVNGWTATRYKVAGAELLERKLVVDAKRERAGRTLFLPGPWEALPAPAVPVEAWKLPLYGVTRDDEGKLHRPFERSAIVPLEPAHELFARAWARVQKGDAPGYEKIEKPKKRR